MMSSKEKWNSAWENLGVQPPPELWAQLGARYSEAHRFYHTLQHLEECFKMLDLARHLVEHNAEITLAIWFHDAIYDTTSLDNEEKSAQWVSQVLLSVNAAQEVAARVGRLVQVTKHDTVPGDGDEKLIVDLDLSILGASEERYMEYEQQIRQEYHWVPEAIYRQGRTNVLASFLERPSIYYTAFFAKRFETQARANLQRALSALVV